MTQKQLIITITLILLTGLIIFFAGFGILFALLFVVLILLFTYYFFHEEQELQQQAISSHAHRYLEEQEAHHWLKHTFTPRVSKSVRKKRNTISLLGGILLGIITFLWNLTLYTLPVAIAVTSIVLIVYTLVVLYLQYSHQMIEFLPKSIRPYMENPWIRGYLTFLPVILFVYLLSPYADILDEGIFTLLDLPKVFIIYTTIWVALFSLWYFHGQSQEEEERKAQSIASRSKHSE